MSFFLFIVVPTFTPPSCYNGQFQLANSNYFYNYYTSLSSVSGYLTGCVNGTFAPVCGEANIGRTELTFACYFITGLACKLSMCAVCACAVCGKVVSYRQYILMLPVNLKITNSYSLPLQMVMLVLLLMLVCLLSVYLMIVLL